MNDDKNLHSKEKQKLDEFVDFLKSSANVLFEKAFEYVERHKNNNEVG